MILLVTLLEYWKDCKEIGKENLAVPLKERLEVYFFFIFLPAVIGLLMRE